MIVNMMLVGMVRFIADVLHAIDDGDKSPPLTTASRQSRRNVRAYRVHAETKWAARRRSAVHVEPRLGALRSDFLKATSGSWHSKANPTASKCSARRAITQARCEPALLRYERIAT